MARGRWLFGLWLVMWCTGLAAAPNQILLDGRPMTDLAEALKWAQSGSLIELGAGVYPQAGELKADNVTIRGEPGAVLEGKAAKGKAALVLSGNNTRVEQLECRNIQVKHKNGACIRLQGRDLTLSQVYFHDSESGVLAGYKPGRVLVEHSRFERLGKNGRAHGIYVGGGQLVIRHSKFLSGQSEGHEVKSGAELTLIEDSVIASLDGRDSRLLDAPNGGQVVLRGNVLAQGPNSSNQDVIGFGLTNYRYPQNSMLLERNVILLERSSRNILLNMKPGGPAPVLNNNIIIGETSEEWGGINLRFNNRKEAGLPPYPYLPDIQAVSAAE